jgi:hypothetical protein
MIEDDQDAGDVYIHVPSPSLSSYAIRYSFKALLPTPEVLFGKEEAMDEDKDEAPNSRSTQQKVNSYQEAQGPEITLNAGISGNLQRSFYKMQFQIVRPDSSILYSVRPDKCLNKLLNTRSEECHSHRTPLSVLIRPENRGDMSYSSIFPSYQTHVPSGHQFSVCFPLETGSSMDIISLP